MHTFKNSLIQTTNKRERSSSISSFFLPSAPSSSSERPAKIAKNNEEYTHKFTGIIYAYCYKLDGTFAYIGQTRQSLKTRDLQHKHQSQTKFDKLYNDDETNVFTKPFVLASKDFEESGNDSDNVEAQCQKNCSEWLDEQEKFFIEIHGTYESKRGFNMTTGGQYSNRHFLFFLASIKIRNERWENEIMPAFRACVWGQKNRIWEIPSTFKMLGKFIGEMRNGRATIPPRFFDELHEMGYMNGRGYFECRFEIDHMPALRASIWGQQKILWRIPLTTKKLGALIYHMRTKSITVPIRFLSELNEMGYKNGNSLSFCKFKFVYMPALRNSTFGKQNRIWAIPIRYPVIGTYLHSMRLGNIIVPTLFLSELNELGFFNGAPTFKIKWEVDYLPICREFISKNPKKKLDDIGGTFKLNDIKIGNILYNLKKNCPKSLENLPESILNELRAMGLTI
jgi:hypothetical protein